MSNLANAVQALEARRAELESELDSVEERLRTIRAALGNPNASAAAAAKTPSTRGTGTAKSNGKAAPAKKGALKRWFERGEAEVLLQKLLTKPKRPKEAIAGLASMKGYAGTLSKQPRERFSWAARSALQAAVQAKRVLRNKDGLLQARTAKK